MARVKKRGRSLREDDDFLRSLADFRCGILGTAGYRFQFRIFHKQKIQKNQNKYL